MLKLCCLCICCLFVNGPPTYEKYLPNPHQASHTEYHNFFFFAILFWQTFSSVFLPCLFTRKMHSTPLFSFVKCIFLWSHYFNLMALIAWSAFFYLGIGRLLYFRDSRVHGFGSTLRAFPRITLVSRHRHSWIYVWHWLLERPPS